MSETAVNTYLNSQFVRELERLGVANDTTDTNEKLFRKIEWALRTRLIAGRLALRYYQNPQRLMHGTYLRYEETGGVLKPNAPCRTDRQGRLYPMGRAAVCATLNDIEQPIRKALLHHRRPEMSGVRISLYRWKDSLGRPWNFTTQAALDRLQDGAMGTVMFWQMHQQIPPFYDEATGETYDNERWIYEDVKVNNDQWTTVGYEDLKLDYESGIPSPNQDLFVINAPEQDAFAFLDLLLKHDNFIDLADKVGIDIYPLSGYFPSDLNPYVIKATHSRR
ncbi:MAG TPA: hypothetical protein VLA77_03525 [Candidatus Saccharimonadales bacterium]|nr:hypothetical protein [Candidatus Saccharimonadales bacterium]